MKLLDEYSGFEAVRVSVFGLKKTVNKFNEEYKRVCKYKYGLLEDIKEEEIDSFEILLILDKLGYQLDEMGTYLFKNMIIEVNKIVDTWDENESKSNYEGLVEQLCNSSSEFYIKICTKELDVTYNLFNKIVLSACKSIDYERMNKELANEIFGNKFDSNKYQSMSIYIANYIRKKRKIKNNKFK